MQAPKFSPEEQARINALIRDIAAKRAGISTELPPAIKLIQSLKDKPIIMNKKVLPPIPLIQSYATPATPDMAVLMAYFNPTNSVRMLQNFLQVRHYLQQANIPLYTGEVAFDESPFLLQDAVVQLRTTSYMFYKENLIKLVEARVPATFTKLCILDADIMFEQPGWYDVVSQALDKVQICQPFTKTTFLEINFTEGQSQGSCFDTTEGHSGHVWAFQRAWYQSANISDQTVVGGSDLLFVDRLKPREKPSRIVSFYKDILALSPLPSAEVTTCPLSIVHLYHGSPTNRDTDYSSLALMVALRRLSCKTLDTVMSRRADGLLEWSPETRPILNTVLQKYFARRNDDEAGTNNQLKFFPISYATPATQDMAVLIVFFNPNPYHRLVQNVLTVKHLMESAGIPYFIAEMAFDDKPFLFNKAANIFQFRSDSYMFYKENLITSAEPLIPPQFTKLCLMDADILFDTPNWYSTISNTLNRVVVTQPFKRAYWLEPNYTINRFRTNSIDTPSSQMVDYEKEHVGFLWAFDRTWFKACKFIDITVISSNGDSMLHDSIKPPRKSFCYKFYTEEFGVSMNIDKLSYDSCNLSIYHLNHGSLNHRQYKSILDLVQEKLKAMNVSKAIDIIVRRPDNIIEWNPKYKEKMNRMLRTYFMDRREDEIEPS